MEIALGLARGILGIAVMIGFCYLMSADRKAINWRLVGGGIGLQIALALMIFHFYPAEIAFQWVADRFVDLLNFTEAGATFMFGAWPDEAYMEAMDFANGERIVFKVGYVFAFKVLPTIVFFSAFSAVLFYLGIMQKIIYAFAWVMSKVMDLSGAESLAAAANVFIGQTEAPLVVKPYLENMTKSEILCLMTGGMATIAGGVFALFIGFLGDDYAIHFLTASIISAPAAIVCAKMMYPETTPEKINRDINVPKEKLGNNLLDAISLGTTDGVKLAVNVGAMLLVFIALIALLNGMIGWVGEITTLNGFVGGAEDKLTLEYILGLIFAPVAWILGVPAAEITQVGQLLGTKTVVNEVVAYAQMGGIQGGDTPLSPKALIIATYALCGFANFSSIGIQIGGISALAPNQRPTLTEFGIKSLIAGTIACFLTGIIAGMLAPGVYG